MAKKTFYNGRWRLLKDDGSGLITAGMFDKGCDPPVAGRDEVWELDGADWRRKLAPGEVEKSEQEKEREREAKVRKLAEPPPPGTKEYMVLSQRDEWFFGKFSPERLEQRLNLLGREGWKVVVATTSDVGTWFGSLAGGARQEMVIVMERTVGEGGVFSRDELRQLSDDRSVP